MFQMRHNCSLAPAQPSALKFSLVILSTCSNLKTAQANTSWSKCLLRTTQFGCKKLNQAIKFWQSADKRQKRQWKQIKYLLILTGKEKKSASVRCISWSICRFHLHAAMKYGRDGAPIYFFSKKLSIHGRCSIFSPHCVIRFVRQNVTQLSKVPHL